jgi:hypothetical protein
MSAPFIEIIDTQPLDLPETGAIYLLRGTALAMIESGTATSAERTLDTIREFRRLDDLAVSPELVFLTQFISTMLVEAGIWPARFPRSRSWFTSMRFASSWILDSGSTARAWRRPASSVTMENPCSSQNIRWCQ